MNCHEESQPDRHELRESPRYRFEVSRRGFIQSLGAGLLICVQGGQLWAQQARGGQRTIAARLHIGEDGVVTVLTGKVEVGQGARTQLAMAAAEELRVSLDKIAMQMADTSMTPDDGGTYGSRTTPANVPEVRAAAAAARELLLETAAKEWGVARDVLKVDAGVIVETSGGRSLSFGDLAKSVKLAEVLQQRVPTDITLRKPEEWTVLGQPTVRLGARDIVTGAHRYPSDMRLPNMLYGKVLRPSALNATLKSIDMNAAESGENLVTVRDGDFIGCAAPSTFEASRAVSALAATAQWDVPPHPSSTELFQYLRAHTQSGGEGRRGGRPEEEGAVDEGFKAAAKVLEATYEVPYIQHVPMEPRTALAAWGNGAVTVWTATQRPDGVQGDVAEAFSLPRESVRVVVPDSGGGFGGKHSGEAAVEAARLAKAAGRPVLLQWTREEEFMWAYYRPAGLMDARAGLDDQGKLTTWQFTNYNAGGAGIGCPYTAPNRRIQHVPCDSPLRQGSYRALAATANNFARESFMDELAEAARQDPLQFRLAHLENERLRRVLEEAANAFGWAERRAKQEPGVGIGLACGTEKGSFVAACAAVRADAAKGTFEVLEICQAFECGAVQNPLNLRAQVEGCIIMGLGGALMEEATFENGVITSASLKTYTVPHLRDVPALNIVLVNRPELPSVGAGETPIIAVAPAIANALFRATGQHLRRLPLRLKT